MSDKIQILATAALLALACAFHADQAHAQTTGSIEGVVQNAAGEVALDAEVRNIRSGSVARVDQQGRFRFDDIPSGDYVLEAFSPRWGQYVHKVSVVAGQTTEVTLKVIPHVSLEEVVVSAGPLSQATSESVRSSDVLATQALIDNTAGSLGESLKGLVGFSSSYFGPGAGRPVIRGLEGKRVAILQQGMAVSDVSSLSPDHATSVETLLADRVEVVRGPATLLYGSTAIGGAVSILDGRVPMSLPDRTVSGTVIGRYMSVAQGRSGGAKLNGRIGRLAWTANGMSRSTGEYRVPPGGILHEDEHDDHDGHDDEDHDEDHDDGHDDEDHDEEMTHIANSDVSLTRGGFGLSYIGNWGYLGSAVTRHITRYGLPGHEHGHEEHHEDEDEHEEEDEHDEEESEEGVNVDLAKVAIDLDGLVNLPFKFFNAARIQVGLTDYGHDELEGDEVGTTFEQTESEARLELHHAHNNALFGIIGLSGSSRDLQVSGEEAFLPNGTTSALALFGIERYDFGSVALEGGLRLERTRINAVNLENKTFSGVQLSAGLNVEASEYTSVSIRAARNSRAPTVAELYADGLHVATGAFEVGNPDLSAESALAFDLTGLVHSEQYHIKVSVFANRFRDFIYLAHTEEEEDGAPVFQISQDDAIFRGVEAEILGTLLSSNGQRLGGRLWSDFTHAKRTADDEPLPRIPPLRVGAELDYQLGSFSANAALTRHAKQSRVSLHETETAGYPLLSASVQYKFFHGRMGHVLTLQGNNLTSEIGRPHTSYVKDTVPLPGRDLRLTYRMIL